jgi:hypothetical protein
VLSTEGGRAIANGGEIVFGVEVVVEAGEIERFGTFRFGI